MEQAFEEKNIAVLGLAEIRRPHEKIIELKSKHILMHSDSLKGQRGVGFLVNRNWKENVQEFRSIKDRIAVLKLRQDNKKIILVQVYAPTLTADDQESDAFYEELTQTINECKPKVRDYLLIMGDFNAQIGQRESEEDMIMGKTNYGKRNKNGWKLVGWCQENNMKIANTYFKKRKGKLWTWVSPNEEYKNQIDFILTPMIKNRIIDCKVERFTFHSDHRLLGCKMKIKKIRYYPRVQTKTLNEIIEENKGEYAREIENAINQTEGYTDLNAIIMKVSNDLKYKTVTDQKEQQIIPQTIKKND